MEIGVEEQILGPCAFAATGPIGPPQRGRAARTSRHLLWSVRK